MNLSLVKMFKITVMGSVTIKILVQSVNVGQIAKKTIQFHIPKDLLKILNDTPTNTQHHIHNQ